MPSQRRETLTQEDLVNELHRLGFGDASVTRIATWRRLELLPQFDSGGHGQGRGAGRDKGCWLNSTEVLNQAVAIVELVAGYRRLEDLYLPLWQMGFAIPSKRVRPALLQPLLRAAIPFEVQEDGRTTLEDVIDDGVAEVSPLLQREVPIFDVPEEAVAAVVNVVANPDYSFNDDPYQHGVSRLRDWERSLWQRLQHVLGDTVVLNQIGVGNENNIIPNAPFINKYLSLPQLTEATQNCTDEELMVVQRDLQIAREMLRVFIRIRELLSPFVPKGFLDMPEEVKVVFDSGRVLVWIDLALRHRGFGPLIDRLMPLMLDQLHHNFNEAVERELVAAGPEIGKALRMTERAFTAGFEAGMSGN